MDSLVTAIFEGLQIENNLTQKLNELIARGARRIQQSNFNTDNDTVFERIQRAKDCFDRAAVQTLLTPYDKYFQKNSQISISLREKGNELYKGKNLIGALRAYTLALAFAPVFPNSKDPNKKNCEVGEELLLAYTNRSAVLLQKNCASAALQDIQRALQILSTGRQFKGIPANLKEKLYERIVKCEQMTANITSSSKRNEDQEIALLRNKLFKVENPSENIPNAESFVEIKFSPERGRHLIVKKDVEAGSVLLIDQPYVSVLNNLLRWETNHCNNCSVAIINGVPCLECSFALFCSEECRDAANSPNTPTRSGGMHHLEHKYLPILHCLDSTHGDIQSLRILAIAPKNEILEVSKNLKMFDPADGALPGFDNNGIYNVHSYLPIFHLISHPPPRSSSGDDDEAINNTMKALLLKEILKIYTNYFKEEKKTKKKSSSSEQLEDIIASLILKHLESIKYNAISLSKLTTANANGKNIPSKSATSYAAAVYPLLSLCNHSCDPNCAPVKQSKHLVTSIVALKHLKEGDELFITYKPLYTQMKTSERQNFLADGYRFICNCRACEENWNPGMIQQQQAINQSSYEQGAMLILQPTRCENCEESGNNEKKLKQCYACALKDLGRAKEIQKMESILFECHDLLMGEEVNAGEDACTSTEECLKRLSKVVDYFGKEGFLSYFPLYNVALDLFKRALVQGVAKI